MTEASGSMGQGFGFARTPASEREPVVDAWQQKEPVASFFPPENVAQAGSPKVEEDRPEPAVGSKPADMPSSAKRRRRASGKGEGKPKLVLPRDDDDVAAAVAGREPVVWLAVSLAGLTVAIGLTGFVSLLRTF